LTIYTWFYRWEEKGLMGLFNEKGRGRKPILLQREREQIKPQVQAHAQQLKVARGVLKDELEKGFSNKP
jgi:transposase